MPDGSERERRERRFSLFTESFGAESGEEILRGYLEDWAHPDVEWVEDPAWPGSATYRGYDEILALRRDRLDSFDFEQTTEGFVHGPDRMVALVRWRGRARSAAVEAEMEVAIVVIYRGGKTARVEFIFDRDAALKGIPEAELDPPPGNG